MPIFDSTPISPIGRRRTGYPALVGLVRNARNEVAALQRIYLAVDGTAKAAVASPKKMLGKIAGGAVRLAAIGADGRLGLCEGIETGLAVMTAVPELRSLGDAVDQPSRAGGRSARSP